MKRHNWLRYAVAAGIGPATVLSSLILSPLAASAAGTPTSIAINAHPSTSTSAGAKVSFVAVVTPARAPTATGSITFTINGSDGSTPSCMSGNTVPVAGGKGKCIVPAGTLLATGSTYSVTASYSGDNNYAGSTNTITQTVSPVEVHIFIKFVIKPTNGGAAEFAAQVKGPKGVQLPGDVLFAVASSTKGKHVCAGGPAQPVVDNVATCNLPEGWIVVPSPTGSNKYPKAHWAISALYVGNPNYLSNTFQKVGTVRP